MENVTGTVESGSGFPFNNSVEQTGYCSQADLEKKIGKQKLAELTNDAFTYGKSNEGAEPDTDVVAFLIAEADQDIDSIVGMRYAVPFTTIPDSIRFLSVNIACYRAFKRKLGANKITEDWQDTYKECLRDLREIASGKQTIGVTASYTAGVIVPPTSTKQVNFYDSNDQMSKF